MKSRAKSSKAVSGDCSYRPFRNLRRASQKQPRRAIVMICGQHSPPEIMTGRLIEPIMREILKSPSLLNAYEFYFVPTVNVDCAHYGGNGLTMTQRNSNRHWFKEKTPETAGVIRYFDSLARNGVRICLAFDVHAGGGWKNHVFLRMAPGKHCSLSKAALAAQDRWLGLFEKHAGLRRRDGFPMSQQRLRATDYFHQVHQAVALCLEMSACSYYDPCRSSTRPFGQETFGIVARGLVAAWTEGLSHIKK